MVFIIFLLLILSNYRYTDQSSVEAAEIIASPPSAFDNRAIPETVMSNPEIATVGMDEESARKSGFDIKVGYSISI